MLLTSMFLLTACQSPPASFRHPEQIVVHRAGRVDLPIEVLDGGGEVLDTPVVATAVDDDAIARVGKDGSVMCTALGTVKVTLQAGSLTGQVPLHCMLISAIEPITTGFSLVVPAEGGEEVKWRVIDLKGAAIEGVPVNIRSLDSSIARVEGQQVHGVTTGRTRLELSAGEKTATIAVRVGKELVREEALHIPEDGTDVPLKAGEWTFTVSANAPVTVEVPGAVCSDTEAERVHHVVCTLAKDASLHVEPTGLLRDPAIAHIRGVFFPES